MRAFLKIDKKYSDKNILIIGHGDPLWILNGVSQGFTNNEIVLKGDKLKLKTGELRKLEFKNVSFDDKGDVDLHRPYIDNISFF